MSQWMALGGFLGYTLTFLVSLGSGGNLNSGVRDGMVGCLVMALLFQFLYRQVEMAACDVVRKERAAAEAEEQAQRELEETERNARRKAVEEVDAA